LEQLSATDLILETPISSDFVRSSEIIRQYSDANIDFVDALIVSMAERLYVTKILTLDQRHFRMFRPKHCEAFEILP
jgi:predicted nucleic acid-binding protein